MKIQGSSPLNATHWRASAVSESTTSFPKICSALDKPYIAPILDPIQREPVLFIEKSRDMMFSWLCVGYFTRAAMTYEERDVLFQSQKEDKAAELIDYTETLYEQQHEQLDRNAFLISIDTHEGEAGGTSATSH